MTQVQPAEGPRHRRDVARVLIAGATGMLGREIARDLKRRGLTVRALSRRPGAQERLGALADEVVVADARRPGALAGACEGVERVVSCLGASVIPALGRGWRGFSRVDVPANRNLIAEATRAEVRKFVYVGVAGHEVMGHLAYVRAHEQVADCLRASGLAHAVVRATGFYSAFGEVARMAARGPVPLFGDGSAVSNPIDDRDLARVCVDALFAEGSAALDAGGPEVLTRRRMVELACEALDKRPRLLSVPPFVGRGAGWLLRPLHPRLAQLIHFYAYVGAHDLVAPARGERRLCDYFAELAARGGS